MTSTEPREPDSARRMTREDRAAFEFLYTKCIEIRNFEINQLVARNNFFMVFQGVLFAGLAQGSGSAPPIVLFAICLAGVLSSVFQASMASGAKFWQEVWEDKLDNIERQLLPKLTDRRRSFQPLPLFTYPHEQPEDIVARRLAKTPDFPDLLVQRFSVSRIPIYAGGVFALIWLMLLACTIAGPSGSLASHLFTKFPT